MNIFKSRKNSKIASQQKVSMSAAEGGPIHGNGPIMNSSGTNLTNSNGQHLMTAGGPVQNNSVESYSNYQMQMKKQQDYAAQLQQLKLTLPPNYVTFSTTDFFDQFVRVASDKGLLKTPLPTPISKYHIRTASIQLLQASRVDQEDIILVDDDFGGTISLSLKGLEHVRGYLLFKQEMKAAQIIQKSFRIFQFKKNLMKKIEARKVANAYNQAYANSGQDGKMLDQKIIYMEDYVNQISNTYHSILHAKRAASNALAPTKLEVEFMKRLNQPETYRVSSEYLSILYDMDKEPLNLKKRMTLLPGTTDLQDTLQLYYEFSPKVLQWISTVLRINLDSSKDLLSLLRSGDILCKLTCALYPNTECTLLEKGNDFAIHKCIFYLEFCKSLLIKRSLLFQLSDLFVIPEQDTHKKKALIVIRAIIAMEKHAHKAGWKGPRIDDFKQSPVYQSLSTISELSKPEGIQSLYKAQILNEPLKASPEVLNGPPVQNNIAPPSLQVTNIKSVITSDQLKAQLLENSGAESKFDPGSSLFHSKAVKSLPKDDADTEEESDVEGSNSQPALSPRQLLVMAQQNAKAEVTRTGSKSSRKSSISSMKEFSNSESEAIFARKLSIKSDSSHVSMKRTVSKETASNLSVTTFTRTNSFSETANNNASQPSAQASADFAKELLASFTTTKQPEPVVEVREMPEKALEKEVIVHEHVPVQPVKSELVQAVSQNRVAQKLNKRAKEVFEFIGQEELYLSNLVNLRFYIVKLIDLRKSRPLILERDNLALTSPVPGSFTLTSKYLTPLPSESDKGYAFRLEAEMEELQKLTEILESIIKAHSDLLHGLKTAPFYEKESENKLIANYFTEFTDSISNPYTWFSVFVSNIKMDSKIRMDSEEEIELYNRIHEKVSSFLDQPDLNIANVSEPSQTEWHIFMKSPLIHLDSYPQNLARIYGTGEMKVKLGKLIDLDNKKLLISSLRLESISQTIIEHIDLQ